MCQWAPQKANPNKGELLKQLQRPLGKLPAARPAGKKNSEAQRSQFAEVVFQRQLVPAGEKKKKNMFQLPALQPWGLLPRQKGPKAKAGDEAFGVGGPPEILSMWPLRFLLSVRHPNALRIRGSTCVMWHQFLVGGQDLLHGPHVRGLFGQGTKGSQEIEHRRTSPTLLEHNRAESYAGFIMAA